MTDDRRRPSDDDIREEAESRVRSAAEGVPSAENASGDGQEQAVGAATAAVDQALGSATSAGVDALEGALDDAGLDPRATAAVSQVVSTAAQMGQGAVRDATSGRQGRAGSDSGASGVVGSAVRAAGGAIAQALGGSGEQNEEVRVFFEPQELADVLWDVARLELDERLNRPYLARVELRTDELETESSRLLGTNAVLLIERGENQQRVPGVITEVEQGTTTGDSLSVNVAIAPALKLLEQRRDTRIFQQMTVSEILQEVLGPPLEELEREVQFALDRTTYPVREYCTQYDETDLDFAHRLMEEEGLGYRFETSEENEVLVIFDRSAGAETIESLEGGAVLMSGYESTVGGHELMTSFRLTSAMRPTALALQHYDWTRTPRTASPADAADDPMPLEALEENEDAGTRREEYEHDNRPLTLVDYDDGAGTYGDSDSEDQGRLRRELQVRDSNVGRGASTVTGMRPGLAFTLEGHRVAELNGSYFLTAVKHTYLVAGTESDERYLNQIICIPADVPYRPERATPRPRVPGLQTATVVGPSGDEIYTDQHGRVKVQFHWDRLGERNEHSSCWVRVQQPWAGAGWGFVFIPRIYMEVTVTFVNGDPDQPLVTGTVYNGVNHPPLDLDDQKTRSTIKTRSTTGSEGYNELTFEDLAGEEQIIVHAQKDYNETVENAHSTTVHGGQTNSVDGDQGETVGGDQSMSVSGARNKTVTGDETNTLEAARTTTVTGLEKLTCQAAREVRVGDSELHQVTAQLTETFDGGRRTTVASGDEVDVTSGNSIANVGAGQYLVTSAQQLKLVQGDSHFLRLDGMAKLGTSGEFFVLNDANMVKGDTGGTLTLQANSEIVLQCGAASISLKADGTIELNGTTVDSKSGSNGVTVESAGVTASGATVRVSGTGSVDITGPTVKVN